LRGILRFGLRGELGQWSSLSAANSHLPARLRDPETAANGSASIKFEKSRVHAPANGVAASVASLPQHTFLL